jgi:hypothetical protein
VGQSIGQAPGDAGLTAWGASPAADGEPLDADLHTAMARSLLTVAGETILPSIAGVREPEHIAVPRDNSDPQYRGYRAYIELMHSGLLTQAQLDMIADYRRRHFDMILGMPTAYAYNTKEMSNFLSYGHGFGLIQAGRIREVLLMTWSQMAHGNTRGQWLAPETRRPMVGNEDCAPYCSPAQCVVPLMTRWLMVFEDPRGQSLWLGKGIPRDWLMPGKGVTVRDAPTRWGRIGYRLTPGRGSITAELNLSSSMPVPVTLSLRAPDSFGRLRNVRVNGRRTTAFDTAAETITLLTGSGGVVTVVTRYTA